MKNKKFRVTRRVGELAISTTIRGRKTGNNGYFVTQHFTSSKFLILILMAVEPSKASISRKIFQMSKTQEISFVESVKNFESILSNPNQATQKINCMIHSSLLCKV